MAISHRLHSSMYERPDEGADQKPKRIVFLSVEADLLMRLFLPRSRRSP